MHRGRRYSAFTTQEFQFPPLCSLPPTPQRVKKRKESLFQMCLCNPLSYSNLRIISNWWPKLFLDHCIFFKDKVVLCTDPSFQLKIDSTFHRKQKNILIFLLARLHTLKKPHNSMADRKAIKSFINRTQHFRNLSSFPLTYHPPI